MVEQILRYFVEGVPRRCGPYARVWGQPLPRAPVQNERFPVVEIGPYSLRRTSAASLLMPILER